MKKDNTTKHIAFNLFLFFISVFLFTSSGDIIYSNDTSIARYEVTKSIAENFDLSIPSGLGIRGGDGRDYSWYGIGQPLLAVPFYIAGKLIGEPQQAVSVMNPLFGAATAVLIYLFSISLGYSRRASLFTAIFYGLGTMAWPLSKQPFDHIVETFFVLLSVYCMYLYTADERTSNLLFSSLYFGIAFTVRYVSLLIVPPLFTMMIIHYLKKFDLKTAVRPLTRDILLFSMAFLPFAGLSLWYNHYRFGSLFETGFSLMASRAGLDFFGGTPLLTGIRGFLISPGKGFFFYSPVALLFFFSIRSFLKRHPGVAVCFIFTITSYLLFLSRNIFWHGDWAWGPRYLLAITPFVIIPIAGLFDSGAWQEKRTRALVFSLFVVSFAIQLAAVSVDFQKYFLNLQLEKKVDFSLTRGEGVPIFVEPPVETYFDWHRSPIIAQFRFVGEMVAEISNYTYSKPPEVASLAESTKANPHMNVLDFWWLYRYFLTGSYSGFFVSLVLLSAAVYAAGKLRRTLQWALEKKEGRTR